MCSAEPHPANCLTDLKKKKIQEGKTANHNPGLSHKGKRSQKVLPFLRCRILIMIFRLSQVSQNIPGDEPMLFHSLCFILSYASHCIISLCSSSACQGAQRARGRQVCWLSPSGWFFFVGGGGQKREGGLLDRRESLEPQKLSDWAWQPEVFLKSAGVSFNSVRNKLELLSNYRNICSQYVNLIVLKLLLS